MSVFSNLSYAYYYFKGTLKFREQQYNIAYSLLKKAIKYNKYENDELLCQYYGQTLLSLKKNDEAFLFLSKAYYLLDKKEWSVTNEEECRLAKDSLDALKYLSDNFSLKVDNFQQDKKICINK